MYKQILKKISLLLAAIGFSASSFLLFYSNVSLAQPGLDPSWVLEHYGPLPSPPPNPLYCYVYCIDNCLATGMCILQGGGYWGPVTGYMGDCCT